jgi:2,3-bisphosphoglycerate-independent phosphoglycerate mutase
MWDRPLEEIEGRTPVEAARTNNMDYMAQKGMVGTVQTIPEGMTPGSDIGNMSLLGYDPKKYNCGRAPLEAASMSLDMGADEIAIRCNLVTVTEDGEMADYSAGHITSKESHLLIDTIQQKLGKDNELRFYPGKSYRHLLMVKGGETDSLLKTETIPPHDILGKKIKQFLPKGPVAGLLLDLMERSCEVLHDHPINKVRLDLGENPANMIWLWGLGGKPRLPRFEDIYGVKGSIISAVDLVNGIGRIAGLEVIDVPGITGYYDTNYIGKAEYALRSLKQNDFVFIHIEAPDEAGHNGDWQAKIETIERIDEQIVGTVLNHFGDRSDVRIMVLPDHPTPIELRTHTSDEVGFVMFGKGVSHNGMSKYNERTAAETDIHFNSGEELMSYFIKKNL